MTVDIERLFLKLRAYADAVPWNDNSFVPYPLHGGHFVVEGRDLVVLTKGTYQAFVARNADMLIERIRKSDDPVSSMFGYISKSYRLQFLDLVKEDLAVDTVGELLSWIWTLTEFPNQSDTNRWTKLFKMVDKTKLMDAEELKVYEDLPEVLTIYRGLQSTKAKVRGLSWTLSLDKAKWFACRWQRVGEVYTAKIRKGGAFAYFNGRGEEEIVVNPRKLEEVQPVYIKGGDNA